MLDQELQKAKIQRENAARQARFHAGNPHATAEPIILNDKENSKAAKGPVLPILGVKKDFFGRIIETKTDDRALREGSGNGRPGSKAGDKPLGKAETKVWVTFHEGLNNAVRKPLTLNELLRGL